MSRLSMVDPGNLTDEQQVLWDGLVDSRGGGVDLTDANGHLVGPFNAWLHAPKIGRRLSSLGALLRFRTSIDRRLSEVAICTVGAHWQSEFEFWAHAPMALEHGVDPSVVEALRAGERPTFTRDDERVVYEVARQFLEERRVDDATYAAGVELLGETGMVELATLVGYYCTISMILNLFEVALPPGETPSWSE